MTPEQFEQVRTTARIIAIESVLASQKYKINFTLRCEAAQVVKTAVRMGMGIGILYQDAVANNLARGNLKLINVPELKEVGMKSVIAYDGRKPLSSIAQQFLELLRESKQPGHKSDEQRIAGINTASGRRQKLKKPQAMVTKSSRKYPSLHPRSVA